MNNRVYLVNLKDGMIITFRIEEFLHHFNDNEFLAHDYNAYLNHDSAQAESDKVKRDQIKKEGV